MDLKAIVETIRSVGEDSLKNSQEDPFDHLSQETDWDKQYLVNYRRELKARYAGFLSAVSMIEGHLEERDFLEMRLAAKAPGIANRLDEVMHNLDNLATDSVEDDDKDEILELAMQRLEKAIITLNALTPEWAKEPF